MLMRHSLKILACIDTWLENYFTWPSHVLIFVLLFNIFLCSLILLLLAIYKPPIEFYVIWKAHLLKVSSFLLLLLYTSKDFVIQIGPLVIYLVNQSLGIVFSLVILSFHGDIGSKTWSLDRPLKLNIHLLLLSPMRSPGYSSFFRTYIFLILNNHRFFVIINLLSILLKMLCSMKEQIILKLITISYVKSQKREL